MRSFRFKIFFLLIIVFFLQSSGYSQEKPTKFTSNNSLSAGLFIGKYTFGGELSFGYGKMYKDAFNLGVSFGIGYKQFSAYGGQGKNLYFPLYANVGYYISINEFVDLITKIECGYAFYSGTDNTTLHLIPQLGLRFNKAKSIKPYFVIGYRSDVEEYSSILLRFGISF
ncbi:MAG: hypothetical protein Q8S04_03610 [Bacteroidales bacterium]|nr:hypothetical protein [Bacteroidales bacterium]